MKRIFLLFAFVLFTLFAFSQGSATLTKEETINYIQKKLREVEGNTTGTSSSIKYITNSISLNDNIINLENEYAQPANYCPGGYFSKWHFDYAFNPAFIEDFSDGGITSNSTISKLKITFSNKSPKHQTILTECIPNNSGYGFYINPYHKVTAQTATVEVYYVNTDPTNYNKLVKAFKHLRDLLKAEDDPFGE